MAKLAVAGPPGFGKTTSLIPFKSDKLGVNIKGLDPKTCLMVDVKGQGAPPGYDRNKKIKDGGNYIQTKDSKLIATIIGDVVKSRPDIKHFIIDDMGYTMGFEQTDNALNSGYDPWKKIAYHHMLIINAINAALAIRPELHFICCYHTEVGKEGLLKIKTSGAMLDNIIKLDGLFNIILYAEAEKDISTNKVNYYFRTTGDGASSCRSPLGMFDEDRIPNDMGLVIDQINNYYNIK